MTKLCKIAKGLDIFFGIVYWVCFIFAIIFLFMMIALPVVNITGSQFNWDVFTYSFNGIQLQFAGENVNGISSICNRRVAYTVALAMSVVGFILTVLTIRIIRQILKPMIVGQPFEIGIGNKFRTLGYFAIVYGIISNIVKFIGQQILISALEGVEGQGVVLSVNRSMDISFFLVAIIVFLCSYIFRYGEELQKQADETL